jgi:hypothetical protein
MHTLFLEVISIFHDGFKDILSCTLTQHYGPCPKLVRALYSLILRTRPSQCYLDSLRNIEGSPSGPRPLVWCWRLASILISLLCIYLTSMLMLHVSCSNIIYLHFMIRLLTLAFLIKHKQFNMSFFSNTICITKKSKPQL